MSQTASDNLTRSMANQGGMSTTQGNVIMMNKTENKVLIEKEKEDNKKVNTISYIHLLSFYVDTLELRIDDHILVSIDNFVQQVNRTIISSK